VRGLFGALAVREAVASARGTAPVQMAAGPTPGPLRGHMKLRERNGLRAQDAPPDFGLHAAPFDAQLRAQGGECCYAARGSAAACSRSATRHGSNSSRRLIGCAAMRSRTYRR